MIYLSKTVYPQEDFEEINRRMIDRGYLLAKSTLNKRMWKCLTALGIIEMKPKRLKNMEKVYQKKQ